MQLKRIEFCDLNARQKEAYNYQKLAAVLADFGLNTIRLTDDWQGADFIAQHCQTGKFLAVQLKGRFGRWKKYIDKEIWVAFRDGDDWYLYEHDAMLQALQEANYTLFETDSWKVDGLYHFPYLSKQLRALLEPYLLGRVPGATVPSTGSG